MSLIAGVCKGREGWLFRALGQRQWTYSQDDFVTLIDQRLGVCPVRSIGGHLLDDTQDLVVQHSKGVMGVGGHGQAGQSSGLENRKKMQNYVTPLSWGI